MKTMNSMEYHPPLPRKAQSPFVQTIILHDGEKAIGKAIWISENDGVVQLLHLSVDPKLGRRGHGGQLLDDVVRQATAYQRLLGIPLRRMWMMVEQKKQVVGRAFLTGHGFHHVGTMNGLHRRQDALMYMRSFN
jgi:ribosomal protein S18 acetylase RimI-like enzyme